MIVGGILAVSVGFILVLCKSRQLQVLILSQVTRPDSLDKMRMSQIRA
jgi:hypothetical protein